MKGFLFCDWLTATERDRVMHCLNEYAQLFILDTIEATCDRAKFISDIEGYLRLAHRRFLLGTDNKSWKE